MDGRASPAHPAGRLGRSHGRTLGRLARSGSRAAWGLCVPGLAARKLDYELFALRGAAGRRAEPICNGSPGCSAAGPAVPQQHTAPHWGNQTWPSQTTSQ